MTTDAVGGVWTYAFELCKALPDVDFLLANMGPLPTHEQRRELLDLPNVEMVEAAYKLEWSENPWRELERAGEWLLQLESKWQPDLVHLNGYVHATLAWNAPVMIAAHSCVLSWWNAVKGEAAPATWNAYAKAVSKGLKACDLVVAPSHSMAASLVFHYGISKPLVIHNARTGGRSHPQLEKEPFVLCAARFWDEAKNVGCLTEAASNLPWPLVLAGDAGSNGHTFKNVRMAGRCCRRAMDSWFQRALIYAHPARYEPFGLAPLEAAHAGCALVLSDIPSLREIWGDAAEFVNPCDPQAWRRTLHRLMADQCEREDLAARASARALRYCPGRMASAYLAVYRSLLPTSLAKEPATL
jgi:glycogen synthase